MSNIEYPRTMDLAHWINERESIRMRKESGVPAPWTLDPVLAGTRFCNVHREDDKVTRYIRNSGVYSGVDVPVWRVVLARMVNRISTLERLRVPAESGDLPGIKSTLKSIREDGTAIWGNAYTISTCGRSMDKVDYVIEHVVQAFMEAGEPEFESLGETYAQLMNVDGFGSFLAAQVVADLKNTPGHPLVRAPDWQSWAAHGPGSLRGLTRYHGRKITPQTFHTALSDAHAQVLPYVANYVGAIHMQDMQNCMCEFDKYIRVQEGGHARNSYQPKKENQ